MPASSTDGHAAYSVQQSAPSLISVTKSSIGGPLVWLTRDGAGEVAVVLDQERRPEDVGRAGRSEREVRDIGRRRGLSGRYSQAG
jgi:hypothetical protein